MIRSLSFCPLCLSFTSIYSYIKRPLRRNVKAFSANQVSVTVFGAPGDTGLKGERGDQGHAGFPGANGPRGARVCKDSCFSVTFEF